MPDRRRTPRYCRQKEKGRPDRAYVRWNGKRILLGNYGSPESYKKYAEIINSKPKKAEPAPTLLSPTMTVLMAAYLAYAVRKYGGEKALQIVHIKGAFRILRRTHGSLLARDFGPKAYKELRLAMVEANWSRSYIRDQCGRMKRFIGWAVSEEILPPGARHALDAVPPLSVGEFGVRETEDVPPVADEVIAATLPHLGPTVADMVRVQRLTGMRPGEVVQSSAEHIDRSGPVWIFKPPQHKNLKRGKLRHVAIGPKAQAIMTKYLFLSPCFRYTTGTYRQAVQRACVRAGVDHWSPNQLRHTAATFPVPGCCVSRPLLFRVRTQYPNLRPVRSPWPGYWAWRL